MSEAKEQIQERQARILLDAWFEEIPDLNAELSQHRGENGNRVVRLTMNAPATTILEALQKIGKLGKST